MGLKKQERCPKHEGCNLVILKIYYLKNKLKIYFIEVIWIHKLQLLSFLNLTNVKRDKFQEANRAIPSNEMWIIRSRLFESLKEGELSGESQVDSFYGT